MVGPHASIPRTIWILWYQGLQQAPLVVRRCVESWVRENPGWDVRVLDESSLRDHVGSVGRVGTATRLNRTKQSNLARLRLLEDHGGVWADATTYCARPLDDWIDGVAESGFFAFRRPGPDRLLATWFLASSAGCPIPGRWGDAYLEFFGRHRFPVRGPRRERLYLRLKPYLNRNERTARWWLSPVFTRLARVYPYHVAHYLFERVVRTDRACGEVWASTPVRSADPAHRLKHAGILSPLTADLKNEIDERRTPIYKLTWKYDGDAYAPGSILHYLLEGRHEECRDE